jgi:hypothetical protein
MIPNYRYYGEVGATREVTIVFDKTIMVRSPPSFFFPTIDQSKPTASFSNVPLVRESLLSSSSSAAISASSVSTKFTKELVPSEDGEATASTPTLSRLIVVRPLHKSPCSKNYTRSNITTPCSDENCFPETNKNNDYSRTIHKKNTSGIEDFCGSSLSSRAAIASKTLEASSSSIIINNNSPLRAGKVASLVAVFQSPTSAPLAESGSKVTAITTTLTTEASSSDNPLSTSSAKRKPLPRNTICDSICEDSALDCGLKSWTTNKEPIVEEKSDSCGDEISEKVDISRIKRKWTSFNLWKISREQSIGKQFDKTDANSSIDEYSHSTGKNNTKNMPLASSRVAAEKRMILVTAQREALERRERIQNPPPRHSISGSTKTSYTSSTASSSMRSLRSGTISNRSSIGSAVHGSETSVHGAVKSELIPSSSAADDLLDTSSNGVEMKNGKQTTAATRSRRLTNGQSRPATIPSSTSVNEDKALWRLSLRRASLSGEDGATIPTSKKENVDTINPRASNAVATEALLPANATKGPSATMTPPRKPATTKLTPSKSPGPTPYWKVSVTQLMKN